jgi:hypothetical protein
VGATEKAVKSALGYNRVREFSHFIASRLKTQQEAEF